MPLAGDVTVTVPVAVLQSGCWVTVAAGAPMGVGAPTVALPVAEEQASVTVSV